VAQGNGQADGGDGDVVIRVTGLRTQFGSNVIHENLDFRIRRGEVMGVVGGSGSGKSVLLRTIVGLIRPAAGAIEILGERTDTMGERQRERVLERTGMLFQDSALFSSMTVAENVDAVLKEHTALPVELRQDIAELKIGLAELPPDAANKYPSELSGGMRKRAGLARALALDPEILFLDEPTAGLDPITAAKFDRLIRSLTASLGVTVVLVTHDLDTLRDACDRISALIEKRVKVGTMTELMDEQDPWLHEYFHGPRGRAAASGRVQDSAATD